jgi:hypothetical protein
LHEGGTVYNFTTAGCFEYFIRVVRGVNVNRRQADNDTQTGGVTEEHFTRCLMYLTGDTVADKLTGNQADRTADKQVGKARHGHTKRHIK